jgi:hypothetical protein
MRTVTTIPDVDELIILHAKSYGANDVHLGWSSESYTPLDRFDHRHDDLAIVCYIEIIWIWATVCFGWHKWTIAGILISYVQSMPETGTCGVVCVVESVLWRVRMTLQFVASLKSYGNQQKIAWSSLQAIALMQQSTLLKLIMEAYVQFGWVCKPHLHWLCIANSRGLHTSPNCTSIRCCWYGREWLPSQMLMNWSFYMQNHMEPTMYIWDGRRSPTLQSKCTSHWRIRSYGVVERHDDVTIVCSIEFLW